jgi:hypothetical protein
MQLAFRKNVWFSDWKRGAWPEVWDTFTNVFSGCGGISHSEILFSDGLAFSAFAEVNPELLAYPPNGKTGPLFIRRPVYDAELWILVNIPATPEQEELARKKALEMSEEGAGYDWRGLLRFVIPWVKDSPVNYFCSETSVIVLNAAMLTIIDRPWTVSPNRLFAIVKKMGWQ